MLSLNLYNNLTLALSSSIYPDTNNLTNMFLPGCPIPAMCRQQKQQLRIQALSRTDGCVFVCVSERITT